jgi:acyl-CoA thioesterase
MNKDDMRAKRIVTKMMSDEGTAPHWGLEYEDGGVGWARVSMVVSSDMLNGHQGAHGGLIFSLADSAFAYACNSRNNITVAQQASISFLSPANLGERLTAHASETALEGRSGSYAVIVKGEDGRIVATFQGLSRTISGKILNEED